jgi:hypothetical protein
MGLRNFSLGKIATLHGFSKSGGCDSDKISGCMENGIATFRHQPRTQALLFRHIKRLGRKK